MRVLSVLIVVLAMLPRAAAAAPSCGFKLGFATVRDLAGSAVVGDCLEDESVNPTNGDALQHTSRGLLVWRKADNFTAFTDGYRSWVNGPQGLQQRLNTEQFDWEKPPATQPPAPAQARPALAASWRRSDVAIVFLQGFGTQIGVGIDDFSVLRTALVGRGWSDQQFLSYSYNGGREIASRWYPNPYTCVATTQGLTASADRLGEMLNAYAADHPGVRFVLVGHSLGGSVAWWYLYRALLQGQTPGAIVGLVTLDAPLLGVGPGKASVMALGCPLRGTGETVTDMRTLYGKAGEYATAFQQMAERATQAGAVVRTVGSLGDCYFYPVMVGCGVPFAGAFSDVSDDRFSQYIPKFGIPVIAPILPGQFAESHHAMLSRPELTTIVASVIEQAGQPR